MSLRLDVEPGQTIKIGDKVSITLENKSGRRARLSIDSKEPVTITTPSEDTGKQPTYQRRYFGEA